MPSTLLSASQLVALIDLLVPTSSSTNTTSGGGNAGPSTRLRHPTDAVAALVHAIMVSLRFTLQTGPASSNEDSKQSQSSGAGGASRSEEASNQRSTDVTDDNDDGTTSEADTAVNDDDDFSPGRGSTEHVDQARVRSNVLPKEWNDRGEDAYTLRYKHEQSSLEFLVKLGRMGGRVSVTGMAGVSSDTGAVLFGGLC